MRSLVTAVLVLVALSHGIGCSGPERGRAGSRKASPKLVVLIVVDQLPTWAFERDRSLFTRGFARLLRDGAYVRAGEIPYANPFTAPGHATIATGTTPNVHGVIGNTWYRRADEREHDAEYDPEAGVFSVGPSQAGELAVEDSGSGRALKVDGLADTLRTATAGKAHSIAIGLKPRAAVFVAGRHPDLAVWYDDAAGGMTTSRAYASVVPPWLVRLARDRPARRFFGATWDARDPAVLARVTGIADDAAGEGAVHGLTSTFPHALATSDAPQRALLHTPFADELVVDATVAALDAMQLGTDDVPDLLAISFNAHDYAGHLWGPGSWETLDLTLRLDDKLGELFELFDRRLGRDGWAVVLTSDHGATPVVERGRVAGARRIPTAELGRAVNAAIAAQLGDQPWVAAVVSSTVYLHPAFASQPAAARSAALDAAAAALRRVPNIAAAGRVDQIAGDCADRRDLLRALCLAVVPGESGELYVVPSAGSVVTDYRTGTHHDAPFADNRQVPIFVMAPGLAPRTIEGSLLQVAPTVAALLRIPPPPAATEAPLAGLVREPARPRRTGPGSRGS